MQDRATSGHVYRGIYTQGHPSLGQSLLWSRDADRAGIPASVTRARPSGILRERGTLSANNTLFSYVEMTSERRNKGREGMES